MKFFAFLFHRHTWKLISANVSGSILGCTACATLECTECGKRQFFSKGIDFEDDKFPTKGAAKVWIESLLPPGHKKLEITETKLVKDE